MVEEDADAERASKAAVTSLSGVSDPFENLKETTDLCPSQLHICIQAQNFLQLYELHRFPKRPTHGPRIRTPGPEEEMHLYHFRAVAIPGRSPRSSARRRSACPPPRKAFGTVRTQTLSGIPPTSEGFNEKALSPYCVASCGKPKDLMYIFWKPNHDNELVTFI